MERMIAHRIIGGLKFMAGLNQAATRPSIRMCSSGQQRALKQPAAPGPV
jgi:hypothetical protein